jgi:hypothetical protein
VYRDQGDYRVVVTLNDPEDYRRHPLKQFRKKAPSWTGFVNPPPAGFGRGIAYDSPRAYDQVARAAISFADDDIGGDTSWVAEKAAFEPEKGELHVGRTLKTAWPR